MFVVSRMPRGARHLTTYPFTYLYYILTYVLSYCNTIALVSALRWADVIVTFYRQVLVRVKIQRWNSARHCRRFSLGTVLGLLVFFELSHSYETIKSYIFFVIILKWNLLMLHAYIEFENIWQISLPQKIFTSENDFWNISMHNLGRHELHYLIESEN